MKNNKYLRNFIILTMMLFLGITPSIAEEAKPIRMIYVHGVLNQDITGSKQAEEIMCSALKQNKINFGGYYIDECKLAYWGDLPLNPTQRYREIFLNGLDAISFKSGENQKYSSGFWNKTWNYISFQGYKNDKNKNQNYNEVFDPQKGHNPANYKLINKVPILNYFTLPGDSGNLRYGAHTFAYDMMWLFQGKDSKQNFKHAIGKIDELVPNENKPYILVAHSAGSVIALKFITDKLENSSNPNKLNNLKGLITFGAPISTFSYVDLAEQIENKAESKPNIFDFFNETTLNGTPRFWVTINHYNDLVASGIGGDVINKSNGTIKFKTISRREEVGPLDKLPLINEPLKRIPIINNFPMVKEKGFLAAHQGWYFKYDKKFAELIKNELDEIYPTTDKTDKKFVPVSDKK